MTKRSYFCGGSMLAVALSFGLTNSAAAQRAAASAPAEVEEVVVTGSYIAGTPEDAALPVDVISNQELEKQGSPTMVQLVKTLTATSGGGVGESNRYNGGAGTAQVSLRGFGANRTLVLFNGRRLVTAPTGATGQGLGVDLNFIPQAAVGRIEILKDGAAATYGSDAVGGVVNFITRKDLNGLEVDGEYALIDGSNGDYDANAAWGKQFDAGNVLLTAGYRHRSRLDAKDRDWAVSDFEDIGYGGWTGASNPGIYVTNNAAGTALFRDNGCTELGGVVTNSATKPLTAAELATAGASPANVCRFQFTNFNDLVNREDHYQLHSEVNFALSEKLDFHGEASWARNEVIDQRISPANLTAAFPTPTQLGGESGSLATPGAFNFFVRYNIPSNHPGLVDLYTTCAAPLTAAQCTAVRNAANTARPATSPLGGNGLATTGIDISQTAFRAIAFAGHPTNADKADHQNIQQTYYRVSGGFKGELPWLGIKFDTAVTYMNGREVNNINDLLVDRIQLALNGYGSLSSDPNSCTAAERANPANAGNAAAGCYFFNPFTNSVAVSAVNGANNPYYRGGANAAVNNNPQLVEWLYGNYTTTRENELLVGDLVFNGQSGINLPGGEIAWAVGAQWRYDRVKVEYSDLFNNQITPCVDSIVDGTPICQAPNGPFIFFGSGANADDDRTVTAFFGEVNFPVLDNLEVNFAIRHEEYKGGIGSTTNPKLSGKWQVLDFLALRGSVSTTFRAPTPNLTNPNCATGVANISGQYRAIRTCGNANLDPETADAYNVGAIVEFGGFTATVDYFDFKFKGELTNETTARLFASMFPTGVAVTDAAHPCNAAAFAPLKARFLFAGDVCTAANVLRIDSFVVNGPTSRVSGVDARVNYAWNDFLIDGSSWSVGVEGTYLDRFSRGAFTLLGAPDVVFSAPEDRAGLHDLTSTFFSYPRLKANGYLNFQHGPLFARWQIRYSEGTRSAFGQPTQRWVFNGTDYTRETLGKTKDFWQHDLTVRYETPWNTTLTASVQNIFDEDPKDAPSQYNYDYTNGNPLGRVFEVGFKARF